MADGQFINKVVYDGTTLIDLTADTADAAHVLNTYTFHDRSGAPVTGTCTYDADTSDANAAVAEILAGKTAYVNGVKLTGTMPNNGSNDVTISAKAGASIPAGYYDGSSHALLDSASSSALVANNIRQGVTVLGIEGTLSGEDELVVGPATATPTSSQQVITAASLSLDYITQVTVAEVPVTRSANQAGGVTVSIL